MRLLTMLWVVMVLGGCGTANYVKQDATGGEIRLDGAFMPSMRQARGLMVDHCRGKYQVVTQGEQGSIEYRCVDNRVSAR